MPPASDVPCRPRLSFLDGLDEHGDRPALLTTGGIVSYRELARQVREQAARLGGERRLALVGASNEPAAIVAYLAALAAGHVVLLADADDRRAMGAAVATYDPDVVIGPDDRRGWQVEVRRPRPQHRLHPELALLLGTSGSTGAARVVRLSYDNLESNAEAIATSLGIRATDRAATSLPLQYCYGLSVVHSHLLRGAALLATDLSVVDRCFWDRFRAEGATTLAGVPYTFDLLDRSAHGWMDVPTLRLVTQAGGRLAPERVRSYAAAGRERGWEFVVMYGQTEATARMAWLPSELAGTHPQTIGRPVPGGSFRVDPVPGAPDGAGELVYRGPNVMLGYADSPSDLALGRTVDELRTGDLARQSSDGLYEIVGRRSSFLKIAGLRIDLEQVERLLHGEGLRTCCAGTDDELVVGVEGVTDALAVRRTVLDLVSLPSHAVRIVSLPAIPRLASGKPDRRAVLLAAAEVASPERIAAAPETRPSDGPLERVRAVYATSLERPVAPGDTFVGLGGDSLSYVQVSLGLEDVLGHLPEDWPRMTVESLAALAQPPSERQGWRRWIPALHSVETGVSLRAVAILLIVATHAGLVSAMGGAHVLLAVAGYNFARFGLTDAGRWDRLRSQVRALARIVVPAVLWIGAALVVTDDYQPYNVVLGNALLGPERWASTWHFWFIEVLVYILVTMAALFLVPAVDRAERRWPFGVAAAVLAAGLLTRSGLVEVGLLHTLPVLWLFAIGWAASRARGRLQRLAVLVVGVAAVPGYFGDVQREATIIAGLVLLILVPRIPMPAWAARGAGVLASASLYIYLVHWQVFPHLQDASEALAVVAAIAAGIVAWLVATWAAGWVRRGARALGRFATRPPAPHGMPRTATDLVPRPSVTDAH